MTAQRYTHFLFSLIQLQAKRQKDLAIEPNFTEHGVATCVNHISVAHFCDHAKTLQYAQMSHRKELGEMSSR